MDLQYPEVTPEQQAHYHELAATLGGSITSQAEGDVIAAEKAAAEKAAAENVSVKAEPEAKPEENS